jgi:putative transcriptional regulator
MFQELIKAKERTDHKLYTYRDIAVATGLSVAVLWRWRQGKVTRFDATTLEKLCKYFNCQPGDLLGLE